MKLKSKDSVFKYTRIDNKVKFVNNDKYSYNK